MPGGICWPQQLADVPGSSKKLPIIWSPSISQLGNVAINVGPFVVLSCVWKLRLWENKAFVQIHEVHVPAGHAKGKLAVITYFAYKNCHVAQIKPATRNQTIKLFSHIH